MNGKEILRKHIVVEGHRDVYEQLYRASIGETSPVRDAIAPRLIRDGINVCVYAISGDSYSHSQNTGRYLETTLDPETGEPYLKPVRVRLFGEGAEDALTLPPYLQDAYDAADEFCSCTW